MSRFHVALTISCAIALSACGGGEAPVAVTPAPAVPTSRDIVESASSFALSTPFKAAIDVGLYQQFELHGSCAGAAEAQKSEALSENRVIGASIANPLNSVVSNFSYTTNNKPLETQYSCNTGEPDMLEFHFDSNREWIGVERTGYWHAIYDDRSDKPLPSTVKVYDSGTLRLFRTYAWGAQLTQLGQIIWSYEVNPLTATAVEVVFKTVYQGCTTSESSSCPGFADQRVEKMHYVLGNNKMLFWKREVTNSANNVSVTYCEKGVDCTKPLVDQIDLFASQLN